ncbi:MAG: hypothetical protein CRN43_02220 [Candidatus Nephrothrix sp. EaCA]|nr:MAG: hypothetical protein CRN43_02220 [Candidatus Nephrothrix sp. EaCA]
MRKQKGFTMAEAAHYMLKYYGLYHLHISDFEALQKVLPQVIDDYNRRPNNVLDGFKQNKNNPNLQKIKFPT